MTYIQIFTGGQPIEPAAIEASGARTLYTADVTDWTEPPTPPQAADSPIRAADMPPSIRALLNKAMAAALHQATGQHWAIQGD